LGKAGVGGKPRCGPREVLKELGGRGHFEDPEREERRRGTKQIKRCLVGRTDGQVSSSVKLGRRWPTREKETQGLTSPPSQKKTVKGKKETKKSGQRRGNPKAPKHRHLL